MKINCESCGSEIPAANINLQDRMAKCDNCNNIFSIKSLIDGISPPSSPESPQPHYSKAEISMPKGISVDEGYEGLEITRKWFGPIAIFLTFFCIFWDGSILFALRMIISSGEPMTALFLSIHAIAGIGLTYWCISLYVNKTIITVNSYLIRVKHTPLPFPGSKDFQLDRLEQVYTKERVVRGKNGYSYYYDLYIIDANDKHTKVLPNLQNKEQALFIEQEIERYLDIEDRYVQGSVTS